MALFGHHSMCLGLPFIIRCVSCANSVSTSSSATTTNKTASNAMTNAKISIIIPTTSRDRLINSFLIYVMITLCMNGCLRSISNLACLLFLSFCAMSVTSSFVTLRNSSVIVCISFLLGL